MINRSYFMRARVDSADNSHTFEVCSVDTYKSLFERPAFVAAEMRDRLRNEQRVKQIEILAFNRC